MVGLLGSIRTSSISLEWGTTNPSGFPLGGGRRSSPTNSSVSGAPLLVGASTFGASFTARFWPSASTTLLTSFSATTAVAPADSSTTPRAASRKRLPSRQRARGVSGTTSSAHAGGGAGGRPAALTRPPGSGSLGRDRDPSTLRRCGGAQLDRDAPQRKPALELWLHGQFGGQLRLD